MDDKIYQMETGELELRKAFEDATTQNVKMIVEFSQDTRKLTQELKQEVKQLKNLIVSKDTELDMIRKQMANIQQTLYSQGT